VMYGCSSVCTASRELVYSSSGDRNVGELYQSMGRVEFWLWCLGQSLGSAMQGRLFVCRVLAEIYGWLVYRACNSVSGEMR